jgi:hypothetical protein
MFPVSEVASQLFPALGNGGSAEDPGREGAMVSKVREVVQTTFSSP